MIDIRVENFAVKIRGVEGKTTDLIYETTLIAGTMVKLMNENRAGTGDMLLDRLKSKDFADMVESMAKGATAIRRDTGSAGWALMQAFAQERKKKHAAD